MITNKASSGWAHLMPDQFRENFLFPGRYVPLGCYSRGDIWMGCCSRGYISLGCCSRENISLGCCFSHCEFGFDSWTYNNGKMAKSAIKGTLRLVYSKMEIWTHRMGIPSIPLSLSVHLIQLVRCHMLPDAIVTARWKKKTLPSLPLFSQVKPVPVIFPFLY